MSIEPVRQGNSRLGELAVLGVSVVAVFAGMIWLVGLQGTSDTPESAGSSQSAGRRGTLALYRWLERSGFEVSRVAGGEQFPPRVDTLIMVNPNGDFPQGQAGSVRRWVEEGHTLILALGSRNGDLSTGIGGRHPMLRELGIDLDLSPGYSSTVPLSQPLFSRPPVSKVKLPGVFRLELPVRDTVVLASSGNEDGSRAHLAALLKLGEGRVFVLASDYPLNNEGLRDEDNGAFIYNMAQAAGGRRVAFDEAHHGQSVGGDLIALLTDNPWGWALLYGVLLTGVYIFWSARRLGPPLPVRSPDQRRPTSDYVTSVAGLFRRARKPGYVAERYLQFFKRTLSRHAELDPTLTDSRFVQALSERGRHTFDPESMLRAVERLRRLEGEATAGEGIELETLKAIREAERVRREALGLRSDSENG
ncbi:MAG TPA: DUF4350 domain-containing protein [Chloroflexia bacterium]|jgi:hypothetical protein